MKMIFSRQLFTGITLFLLMLWLALIPMSAFAATSHTSVPDFATIDAYVLAQMRQLHIPGVALGIMHGSQVVHLRGFGIADPSGRSVTPQTTFAISSMTKSFTAVAIMQLVEPGKVTLDAPVQRYLPWFRVATPNASGKITVRELLNQTSGISHSAGNGVLADTGDKNMQQAVQTLSTVELFAPLGTAFQYSNINYVTLGLIAQVASGQTYEMYVQQHIFAPLQMNNAFTLTSQDTTMHNGMATGYRWWFGLPIPFNHHGNPPAEVALPIGLFVELPKALGVSWAVALLFWPDFSFWLLGMFVFLLITGMARIVRIIGLVTRSRRKNRGTSPVPI